MFSDEVMFSALCTNLQRPNRCRIVSAMIPRLPRWEYSCGRSAIRQMFAASSNTTTIGGSEPGAAMSTGLTAAVLLGATSGLGAWLAAPGPATPHEPSSPPPYGCWPNGT